ncbi:hypothetical protein HDE_04634 [Halotydeus destructor]|nr:hypothetical protein HDE_04634 [Halotydeus destructor]
MFRRKKLSVDESPDSSPSKLVIDEEKATDGSDESPRRSPRKQIAKMQANQGQPSSQLNLLNTTSATQSKHVSESSLLSEADSEDDDPESQKRFQEKRSSELNTSVNVCRRVSLGRKKLPLNGRSSLTTAKGKIRVWPNKADTISSGTSPQKLGYLESMKQSPERDTDDRSPVKSMPSPLKRTSRRSLRQQKGTDNEEEKNDLSRNSKFKTPSKPRGRPKKSSHASLRLRPEDQSSSSSDAESEPKKTPKQRSGKKREYTEDEDVKIIRHVVKEARFNELKGNLFWKEAEDDGLCDRTWQSLKNRFQRYIYPALDNFSCLTVEEAERIRAAYETATYANRKFGYKPKLSVTPSTEVIPETQDGGSVEGEPNETDFNSPMSKSVQENGDVSLSTSSSESKNRMAGPFTRKEDIRILHFIWNKSEQDWKLQVKGNSLWKQMETENVTHKNRTWQSLKERFLKRIIPALFNYKLNENKVDRFLMLAGYSGKKAEAIKIKCVRSLQNE